MLYPPARVRVEALASSVTSIPKWGGIAWDRSQSRRVVVEIADESRCALGINLRWSRVEALANLIEELAHACGHRFRGSWFPKCRDHLHAANTTISDGKVALICPVDGTTVDTIVPDDATPAE